MQLNLQKNVGLAQKQATVTPAFNVRGNVARKVQAGSNAAARRASSVVRAVDAPEKAAKQFGVFRLSYDVNNVSEVLQWHGCSEWLRRGADPASEGTGIHVGGNFR
eukprot:scaffold13233_cov21-Tisochrysis_lutea.AAC.4